MKKIDHTIATYIVLVSMLFSSLIVVYGLLDDIYVLQTRLSKVDDRLYALEVVNIATERDIVRLQESMRYVQTKERMVQFGDRICNRYGDERAVVGADKPGVGFALIRMGMKEADFGTLTLKTEDCPDCMGIVPTLKDVDKYMKEQGFTFAPCKN